MGANDLYWLLCARSERRTLELVERFQGEIFEVAAPIESHCGNAEASPMTNLNSWNPSFGSVRLAMQTVKLKRNGRAVPHAGRALRKDGEQEEET